MPNDMLTAEPPAVTADLQRHYAAVRRQSAYLCEPLNTEDYVVQPTEDVSPPKWHLAHTTWFFEQFVLTKLSAQLPGVR